MAAVKATNRINVFINKNFIIEVMQLGWKKPRLTSANKLSNYLKDEKLKIKLFKQITEGKKQQYTFRIRERLKIDFRSK